MVENYTLHYNDENSDEYSARVKDVLNCSSCVLLVLSDEFMKHEWTNEAFTGHLRSMTSNKVRFVCVKLINLRSNDKIISQHLNSNKVAMVSEEEFLFWRKLGYHLYTNRERRSSRVSPALERQVNSVAREPTPIQNVEVKKGEAVRQSKVGESAKTSPFTIIPPASMVFSCEREYENKVSSKSKKRSKLRSQFLLDEIDSYKQQLRNKIHGN